MRTATGEAIEGEAAQRAILPPTVTRHRFTTDKYHDMIQAGVLHEDDKLELIEGEIIERAPVGSRHAACVNELNLLLILGVQRRATVSVRNPLRLDNGSEPEPDIMLLEFQEHRYADELPTPQDVLLLIEVASTSLDFDRAIKLPLYARAGVREVWLVDPEHDLIAVSRDPSPQGYETLQTYKPGATLTPLAFSDLTLEVSDVLLL